MENTIQDFLSSFCISVFLITVIIGVGFFLWFIIVVNPKETKKLCEDMKERQKKLRPRFCTVCGCQYDVDVTKSYNENTGEREKDKWFYRRICYC